MSEPLSKPKLKTATLLADKLYLCFVKSNNLLNGRVLTNLLNLISPLFVLTILLCKSISITLVFNCILL